MLAGCPKEAAFWIQAHATRLPFRDASFDCLWGWEILHHLENPIDAVREFARVTRRYLILFEPNRYNPIQFLFGLLDPSERGTLRFSKRKIEELLRCSGLTVLHSETVGATFPNRMPVVFLPMVQKIPFSLPFFGISAVGIGVKEEFRKE